MKDIEILLEERTKLKVGKGDKGKTYMIGSFSYDQLKAIGQWFMGVALQTKAELKGKTNSEDMIKLLSVVDKDSAAEFFSIILDDTDKEYIKSNILSSGRVFSAIIREICALNTEFFENFSAVAGTMMKTIKAETLSPSLSK